MVRRALLPVLAVAALVLGVPVARASSSASTGAREWAPVESATIRPGVQTRTAGQCTANFVFFNDSDVFIGQSAHCASKGEATHTNGCTTDSLPLGTPVRVNGATKPGTLVYSSWLTMRANGERDPNACQNNDFALVRLDPSDERRVNPTVPLWGGPTGISPKTVLGDDVYSYGSSGLRPVSALSPKTGVVVRQAGGGWTHVVYTASPGVPGDSGSAFLGPRGSAIGVLSTLRLLPEPASNGVSDLSRMLAYMHAHSRFHDVKLALGTEPFFGLAS